VRLRAIALAVAGLTGAAVGLNAWLAAGRRRRPPRQPAIPGRSKMSKAEFERTPGAPLAGRPLAA
jgi:hypothetical protein